MEKKFQEAVKAALALHGQSTWGNKHSLHVILTLLAEETGTDVKDLAESESAKFVGKVINPSAFAQWLEKHVKGFQREKRATLLKETMSDFSL